MPGRHRMARQRAPVPYDEALAFMERARRRDPRRHRARVRLAARASAAVHRRHQRRSGRAYQSARISRSTKRAAAAATPITARASASAMCMLDLEKRGKDIRRFVHALEGWMIDRWPSSAFPRTAPRAASESGSARASNEAKIGALGCAREALGHAPRLCAQRRARPRAFRRALCPAASPNSGSPALPILGNKCR